MNTVSVEPVKIPANFKDVDVMSNLRKEYYIKTFTIRFETLLKKVTKI